jgi:hypothetical protein
MPEIALRRASQIVNRIAKETQFETEVENDDEFGYRRRKRRTQLLSATARVSIDGNPTQRVAALRENLLNKRNRNTRLMAIATRIRQAAGVVQAQCGVTALVTERVTVVKQIKVHETLLAAVSQTVYDQDEFQAQVEATRERLLKAANTQAVAEIEVPLLTDNDRRAFQEELTGLKRRLLDIDDELADLNSTYKITIRDDDEKFLRQEGIA